MKIDFNFELGLDASGGELSGYYQAWYRLLDEIRLKHPQTVFEGCASGAMRLDLASLSHFDGHFLTDTVNPVDVVRIWQGCSAAAAAGTVDQVGRDAVGGPDDPAVHEIAGRFARRRSSRLAAPFGSPRRRRNWISWRRRLCRAFSDSAAIWPACPTRPARGCASTWRSAKQWRPSIRRSVAHLLTPPALKSDREGWVAVQLSDRESGTALLFVYRLNDGSAAKRFALRDLDPAATYELTRHIPTGEAPWTALGADLMSRRRGNRAALAVSGGGDRADQKDELTLQIQKGDRAGE